MREEYAWNRVGLTRKSGQNRAKPGKAGRTGRSLYTIRGEPVQGTPFFAFQRASSLANKVPDCSKLFLTFFVSFSEFARLV